MTAPEAPEAPTTKRGRGRPRTGDKLTVAFPRGLAELIDAAARNEFMSRSEWVRRACAERLARTTDTEETES